MKKTPWDKAIQTLIDNGYRRLKHLAFNHNAYKLHKIESCKGDFDEYEKIAHAIATVEGNPHGFNNCIE